MRIPLQNSQQADSFLHFAGREAPSTTMVRQSPQLLQDVKLLDQGLGVLNPYSPPAVDRIIGVILR